MDTFCSSSVQNLHLLWLLERQNKAIIIIIITCFGNGTAETKACQLALPEVGLEKGGGGHFSA